MLTCWCGWQASSRAKLAWHKKTTHKKRKR
jgi:hypothetical protein